jgi:hypothetical protein
LGPEHLAESRTGKIKTQLLFVRQVGNKLTAPPGMGGFGR